tara:strand:- start:3868 stop:4209 length:342 start_codon:yes stop_codon:yes gene_type:complete
MKFFGQRLKDFKVIKLNKHQYVITAPTYDYDYRTGERRRQLDSRKIFDTRTNELESPKMDNMKVVKTDNDWIMIDDQYKMYNDGVFYDTIDNEDIPQKYFDARDELLEKFLNT